MRLIPDRIGAKLNVSILLFLLLLAGATAVLVYAGFERTQRDATESSERGLEAQGSEGLAQFASFNAAFGQAQLEATAGLAQQAARFMSDAAVLADAPDVDLSVYARGANDMLRDVDPSRRTDVVVAAGVLDQTALRDIRESAALDDLFPSLLPGFAGGARSPDFDAVAIHFNGLSGVTRFYPRSDSGDAVALNAVTLASVGPEANPGRATVWTAPYEGANGEQTLTAMSPVYIDDQFRGAISVDLSLARLSAQVDGVRPTPGGYAFYIDRDGGLLPTAAAPSVQAAIDDPSNDAFAATLAAIRRGETGVDRGTLQGREVFVAYTPLQGVGGSLALVAPIDELTIQADAVAASIEHEENRTVAITLAVMAGFFVAALAGTAILSRRLIMRPIEAIVSGTRAVAAGDLTSKIAVTSGDELGVLSESFNAMTAELATSRAKLDAQQEQMRESEAELRALFAAMTDVVFVISSEGEYLRAAPTIPALSESNRNRTAQLIGRRVTDVLEPVAGESALAAIQLALNGGGTQSFEYRVSFEHGESRWYNAVVSPMTSSTVLWVARDVTRRLRDEQLLAEREQQYRSIFEAASDALFITDLDDRIIDANPAACAMHGYTLEEMRALPPFSITEESYRQAARESFRDIGSGRERRGRMRNQRKDGSTFPVDAMGTPITYRGEPHVLVVMRDITDQIESEQLLEQRVADRTQEVASLLDVARSVASSLEIDRLVEIILNEIQSIVGYTTVSLLTLEGEEFTVRNWRTDETSETGAEPARMRFPKEATAPYMSLLKRGQPLIIADVRDDSTASKAYRDMVGDVFDTPLFAHARALMIVPMIAKDRLIGALSLSHQEPGFYTQERAQPVAGIAAQAALALDNARLFEQVEKRAREMSALLHVSRAVVSSLDLHAVAQAILLELAHVADYTGATLAAIEGDELVILDSFGPFREEVLRGPTARIPLRAVPRSLWRAMEAGGPIVINDTTDDSPESTLYRRIFSPFLDMASFRSIRSWLAVPLTRQGEIIGMLTASHEETHHFTQEIADLVLAAAGQTAVAIENARLYEEAQQRSRELTSLLGVSRGIVSTLETAPLLEIILREVNSVAPYDTGAFMILNGDWIEEVAVANNLSEDHELESHLGRRFRISQNAQMWQVIERGEPIIIDDVRGESGAARAYQNVVGEELATTFGDVRSWLGVPVATKDRVLGMLALARTTPGFYTARHGALAAAFGAQAAVALENARLFEQTEERTRELATLLDVSRNMASTLELQPLLKLVLEQVAVVAEYDRASVLTLDENKLRVLCVIDRRGEFAFGARVGAQFNVAPNSDLWASLSSGNIVLIDDVRDDSVMARSFRQDVAPQVDPELQRTRGWMAAPLILHDRIIGIFALTSEASGAFDAHQGELVQAIGAQAAVAIENARLYEESQQRGRETEALLRADEELFRSLDLDNVLQALADVAIDVMRADKCVLTFIDGGEERVAAARNFSEEGLVSINRQVGERSRMGIKPPDRPFVLNDIEDEKRPQAREMWASEGIRSYMALPIFASGVLIGGFGVAYTSPHAFGEGEKRVFQALAERGGAAIQNAGLYERAQHAASLEERQRLARELHDSVSQALYGIALGARTARTQLDRDASKAVEPVDYVLSLAEAGLAEMRALIFELRPESLETEGLVAGLEKQAAALRARHNIEVEAELCAEPDVPLTIKEAVSRIAQEAMHNTVKHARATHVWLRLSCDNGSIALEVRDDGRGFDPTQPYAGHLGLRSMRERAEKLGGTIAFESAEGKGTLVRVSIPVSTSS